MKDQLQQQNRIWKTCPRERLTDLSDIHNEHKGWAYSSIDKVATHKRPIAQELFMYYVLVPKKNKFVFVQERRWYFDEINIP